jgi:type I restriction enzyme S subunit
MSEWSVESLGDIAEIRFSNVDKKDGHGEVPVRLCNYLDVYGNDYITADLPFIEASATRAEIERFRVEKGDVMVTKDSETPDDIGIPAVVMNEIDNLVCGYHLALIKPHREKVDSVYLAKQLASKPTAAYFSRLANGSTRYGLSSSSIASTPVWLAPLRQQRRIAEILSTLDEAIEQTEALIVKYQQIKAGLMHDLFTRGVTPDGKLRPTRAEAPQLYKQSPLGWIPKEWEVGSLISFAASRPGGFVNGPFGSDLLTSELTDSGVPVIYVQDIKEDDYRRVSNAHVTEEKANELLVCNVRFGDVLVAKVGDPPGLAAVYLETQRAVVTQDVIRIRPADDVRKITIEGTRARVSLTEFKCLLLPKPIRAEQELIAGYISANQRVLSAFAIELEKLKTRKHGLMHDLLTGRVRVKVAA